MEWVETTAKSVEQAKDIALDRLGVDEHDAEFEILEEPRPGLFGRVRGEARVRARVRPVQPRPKVDRERRRSGRSGGGGRGRGRQGGGGRSGRGDQQEASTDAAPAPQEATSAADDTPPTEEGTSRQGGRSGGRNRRRRQDTTAGTAERRGEEPTMNQDVTVEEQGSMIREFLDGLVDAFGYDADVASKRIDEDTVEVSVDGEDLGLLVGPKGATLQAIHDLSRTVVQRRASGNHEGRVRIDVAGYRERRREALERFTKKVASEVLDSGSSRVLEPMAPADRKIVHDTINTITGVRTTSEGDEPRRRVVIIPDDSE